MVISHKDKLVFFNNKKVASLSIEQYLKQESNKPYLSSNGKEPFVNPYVSYLSRHITTKNLYDMLSGEPFGEEILNTYWKFAFVRNPLDRYVSMYHWYFQLSRFHPNFPKDFPTLDSWIENTYNHYKKTGAAPFERQHEFTHYKGEQVVDFIGKFESINEDFKVVQKRLNCDEGLPHINTTKHKNWVEYFTQSTANMVIEMYDYDFKLFRYDTKIT
jgi:hypothetical protein